MIDLTAVNKAVEKAALDTLRGLDVSRAFGEPTLDSDGREALHVTVVLRHKHAQITGDQALDTLVSIQNGLREIGDDRFAIVDFVTEDELISDGDPES